MASLLPVRAFNRSQRFRVGPKALSPTATKYVNIDNPRVRRDIARHSTLGAIFPLGDVVSITDDGYVDGGGTVSASSPASLVLRVTAGSWVRNSGARVAFNAGTVTLAAADGTNPRIDLVVVNNSGTLSKVDGTAAASPARPAVPANSVALAEVRVPANDTAVTQDQITDLR